MVVFLSSSSGTVRRRRDTDTDAATAELDIEFTKIILKKETEVTDRDLKVLYR